MKLSIRLRILFFVVLPIVGAYLGVMAHMILRTKAWATHRAEGSAPLRLGEEREG